MSDSTLNLERTVRRLRAFLGRNLTTARVEHSLSTAEFCRKLSERFGLGPERGLVAGLGHDIARELPDSRILELADGDPSITDLERGKAVLLHGRAGAVLLRERFGVFDEEILEAVRHHTLGKPGLGAVGKALFVSDYLEPLRKFIADDFRIAVLGLSLDEMVCAVIGHSRKREKTLAPITRAMYDELEGNNR